MSDYSNLVQRLRGEHGTEPWQINPAAKTAADAIEAQAKRIAELEAVLEDEREHCAKIAERFLSNNEPVRLTASSIAAAIRERSNEHI